MDPRQCLDTAEQSIVIMDDFVDGGMCDLARDLNIHRLNK
jgi:hypothetical protein